MTLYEKILSIYPDLSEKDFMVFHGTILLQDDNNGSGAYIAKWDHPDYPRPTDVELAALD